MKRYRLWLFLLVGIVVVLPFIASAQGDPTANAGRFARNWPGTDFSNASISLDEVIALLLQDQIPPYYPEGYVYPADGPEHLTGSRPRFTTLYDDVATTDQWLPDEQQVIAVEVNGDARAYPLILLNNNEIANTEIGGVPVAVTFCPLCNSSIVFDRRLDGDVFHFGVSGNLRKSDLVMWDHETQSWWQQFTGEAIVGEKTGAILEVIPSLVTGWGDFKTAHPDGLVLRNQSGPNRLDRVSYAGYDARGETQFFTDEHDERLFPTERVLAYFGREGAIAYPFQTLAEIGVVNDRIGGEPVVVLWQAGAKSLFTSSIETGSAGLYKAILADETTLTFVNDDEGVITDEQTGSIWSVFGKATAGELEGTQLEIFNTNPHFWFAWAAFRPETLIWESGLIADEAWATQ